MSIQKAVWQVGALLLAAYYITGMNTTTKKGILLAALCAMALLAACVGPQRGGRQAESAGDGDSVDADTHVDAVTHLVWRIAELASEDEVAFRKVKIGDLTWMAENLNVETEGSWCYEGEDSSCVKYGRLYTWDAATRVCPAGWRLPNWREWSDLALAVGGVDECGKDTVGKKLSPNIVSWSCGSGNHDIAGKKLKSKSGWRDYRGASGGGTDDYGFSALPGGYRDSKGVFVDAGLVGSWWGTGTGMIYDTSEVSARYMGHDFDHMYEVEIRDKGYALKGYAFSVRCIRVGKADYRTVKIGDLTWMAENLNIETEGSWCPYYSEVGCAKYGRLYTWDAAMKACPAGWHLPSREEWGDLAETVGGIRRTDGRRNAEYHHAGKKLKSKDGWDDYEGKSGGGTDDYGFSALPGGYRRDDGNFIPGGGYGFWWIATELDADVAYNQNMDYNSDDTYEHGLLGKGWGLSVRCVRDRQFLQFPWSSP